MKYDQKVFLKDGRELLLRSGTFEDGPAVYDVFQKTHAETDYLLSYPDESTFTPEQECGFLKNQEESSYSAEILAFLDGEIVGCAGINPIGEKDKVKHRAELGISVLKAFWGLGIGKALMTACIQCAENAGFLQLELEAVAENTRAVSMYEHFGFTEFGRNPLGFRSRQNGYQELVSMRLLLKDPSVY